jgi:hypothetical protein
MGTASCKQEPWAWKYRQGILLDGSLSGVFTHSSLVTEMLLPYTPGSWAMLTMEGAVGVADLGTTGLVADMILAESGGGDHSRNRSIWASSPYSGLMGKVLACCCLTQL